jgi:hypothetical protein
MTAALVAIAAACAAAAVAGLRGQDASKLQDPHAW